MRPACNLLTRHRHASAAPDRALGAQLPETRYSARVIRGDGTVSPLMQPQLTFILSDSATRTHTSALLAHGEIDRLSGELQSNAPGSYQGRVVHCRPPTSAEVTENKIQNDTLVDLEFKLVAESLVDTQ